MFDVIFELIGATLFLGQAIHFLAFSDNANVPNWSDRTAFPVASPDWAGTYEGSEMGAHQP